MRDWIARGFIPITRRSNDSAVCVESRRTRVNPRLANWYLSILDTARATARGQHYAGARWPKQVAPDGRESPSDIGALLIWQQPHPLYLLELLYRGHGSPERERLVARYAELVEATARFMASFVEERDGIYHLSAPLVPAQEFYDAKTTEDPTFELAYWWWGLEIAHGWRERALQARCDEWQAIQDGLALPHQEAGRDRDPRGPPGPCAGIAVHRW